MCAKKLYIVVCLKFRLNWASCMYLAILPRDKVTGVLPPEWSLVERWSRVSYC